MIAEILNRHGLRCEACTQVPPSWFAASCPSGCGFSVAACGNCASRKSVEESLAVHTKTCAGAGALSDLESTVQGFVGALQRQSPESFTKRAARIGADMGAARGPRGRQVGALAGALAGAFADHTLGRPEVVPVVKVAQKFMGLAGVVREALRKDK